MNRQPKPVGFMLMVDLLAETLVMSKGRREHAGTLLVSVYEVFPVNPEFNSILLQGLNMTFHIFKAIVQHFEKYTYPISCQELGGESGVRKTDTTLMSLH